LNEKLDAFLLALLKPLQQVVALGHVKGKSHAGNHTQHQQAGIEA
jgi:hypothetical protein